MEQALTDTQRRGPGQVRVSVNGRSYKIGCDAGEESRIIELGQYLDSRVSELAGRVGQIGDERLLLMAALVLADDLAEAVAELETLRQAPPAAAEPPAAGAGPGKDTLPLAETTQRLGRLASRVEDIAARVAST